MGLFITFEGPEGSGKTSVANAVTAELIKNGVDVVLTREPGGTPLAEQIRAIILSQDDELLDARAEALLFAASRRQHLVNKIWPALEKGQTVICDRFIDSSLAYQGEGRGLGVDQVLAINEFATEKRMPDLTLLFDIRPEVGLARIMKNDQREVNRLDLEALNFHQKVRDAFLALAKRWPKRYVIINAEQDLNRVINDTLKVINDKLEAL